MLCFALPARVFDLVWVSRSAVTAYRGTKDASWSIQLFDKGVAAAITAVTGGSSLLITKQLAITD